MDWRAKLIFALLAVIAILNAGSVAVHQTYRGPGSGQVSQAVIIPPGDTEEVALTLTRAGVIEYSLAFRAVAWWTRHDGPLRAGEYLFPAHASLHQILDILRFGAEVQHRATIPEGLTSLQIASIINHLPEAKGQIAPPPEGSLLPQTYDYVYNTPRATILARMQASMRVELAQLWPGRDQTIPLQTPDQAVILASIVQQETPLISEMPMIAAVYENRLRLGMKLQADPTVIFAASHGAQSVGLDLTKADLQTDSAYNTYLYKDMPPGAICSPGVEALKAVLHPSDSDVLYFVSMDDGTHRSVFSHSLKQHQENIKRFLDKTP